MSRTDQAGNGNDHAIWIVLVIVALVAAFSVRIDPQDWSQFKPDLLAALLAVAGGVPAGLWLNRMAERGRRAQEEVSRVRRRRVVLEGLLKELDQNGNAYQDVLRHDEPNVALMPLGDCMTSFWHALAASGTLNVIDDAELLSRLSTTYYLADMFNGWARSMREVFMENTPIEYRKELMGRAWPQLLEAARKAAGSRAEVVPLLQRMVQG